MNDYEQMLANQSQGQRLNQTQASIKSQQRSAGFRAPSVNRSVLISQRSQRPLDRSVAPLERSFRRPDANVLFDAESMAELVGEIPDEKEPVKEQGDPDPKDVADPKKVEDAKKPDTADALLAATGIPPNSETEFIAAAADEDHVQSEDRGDPTPPAQIDALAQEVDMGAFYVKMMNEGNFIDIQAQLAVLQQVGSNSPGILRWISSAKAAIAAVDNPVFHATRCQIFQPLARQGQVGSQELIEQAKAALLSIPGVPANVTPDQLSWDAISFKIPANAMECFCQRVPKAVSVLNIAQLETIQKIENLCGQAIKEVCAEYRQRTNTREDEFFNDTMLYLESQLRGQIDPDRGLKVASMGRALLFEYLDRMCALFLTGNIPSSLQPAKIYACHDIVTAAEMRASIQKLAEGQIYQQGALLAKNPMVMNRAYAMSTAGKDQAGRDWTQQQAASIYLKASIDKSSRRLNRIFGDNYDQPMANLSNQLAGSANTLANQVEARTTDAVMQANETETEVGKQQMSILLACLRIRGQAIQQSDWEMMSSDDLDHFEIIKFLSHQTADVSQGTEFIYKMASSLQEMYINGHNYSKFKGKELPDDLMDLITYTMHGRAKILAKSIPLIDEDMKMNGSLFPLLMRCITITLCQRNRIEMETRERIARKSSAAIPTSETQLLNM